MDNPFPQARTLFQYPLSGSMECNAAPLRTQQMRYNLSAPSKRVDGVQLNTTMLLRNASVAFSTL